MVDGLLPVAMFYGEGPWRDAQDIVATIDELFGIALPVTDIVAALDRATGKGAIVYDGRSQSFALSRQTDQATQDRIEAAEQMELSAQQSWLNEVEHLVSDLGSDRLWICLMNYAGRAFLRHGADAIEILGATASLDDMPEPEVDEPTSALLIQAMVESKIDPTRYNEVAAAVSIFFNGMSSQRTRYVADLVDSMFNLLAINVDDDTKSALLEHLPPLTIFLDTNIVYSLIGAQAHPLAASSADLLTIIADNHLPFKVYYHEKTLVELEQTIAEIGNWLTRRRWPQLASRILLNTRSRMPSIEAKYHEINAQVPTPPEVFLSRYSNLPSLLNDLGLTIFREGAAGDTAARQQRRAELVAEYEAFVRENRPKNRQKPYRALDHDMTLWLTASSRQTQNSKAPLLAGTLVLSGDYLLRRFDRQVLADAYGSGTPLVVMPDALFQALRPFISATSTFDATFIRLFSTPEFRGLVSGMSDTVSRVASYLATYEGLPEETATNILTSSVLMTRLRRVDEHTEQFQRVIHDALVAENESLVRDRESVRREVERIGEQTKREAAAIQSEVQSLSAAISDGESGDVDDILSRISRDVSRLADHGGRVSITNSQVYLGGEVTEYSGGYYANNETEVGAQGPYAVASNFQQNISKSQLNVDMGQLAEELEALRAHLSRHASTADEYHAVAEVVSAKAAIADDDRSLVLRHLRNAGAWVLDAAKEIGTSVAAEALKVALGLES